VYSPRIGSGPRAGRRRLTVQQPQLVVHGVRAAGRRHGRRCLLVFLRRQVAQHAVDRRHLNKQCAWSLNAVSSHSIVAVGDSVDNSSAVLSSSKPIGGDGGGNRVQEDVVVDRNLLHNAHVCDYIVVVLLDVPEVVWRVRAGRVLLRIRRHNIQCPFCGTCTTVFGRTNGENSLLDARVPVWEVPRDYQKIYIIGVVIVLAGHKLGVWGDEIYRPGKKRTGG